MEVVRTPWKQSINSCFNISLSADSCAILIPFAQRYETHGGIYALHRLR